MGVVLVTGGAGFIGSHVAETLALKGYDVVVLDDFSSGSMDNLRGIQGGRVSVVRADVSEEPQGLRERLRGLRPGDLEGVMHLAAVVSVEEARADPGRALRVNVMGTYSVLELARILDAGSFVLASSVAVYGEPRYLPLDEGHPLEPVNLYGETKLMAERILWSYTRDYGLRGAALRIFNVYGPRMRGGPYAGVVHRFITALLRGEAPVVYGDGEQTRDYVYIGDVVDAFIRALERRVTGPINIGSGRETSVNQLLELVCRLLSIRCPSPQRAPPRPGDVRRSRASTGKARELLGWRPKTTLEEGLLETISYYKAVMGSARPPGPMPQGCG